MMKSVGRNGTDADGCGNILDDTLCLDVGEEKFDAQEVVEWRESLLSLIANAGIQQARRVLDVLVTTAQESSVGWRPDRNTPYMNTVDVLNQPKYPGNLELERKLASIVRWNALAMVVRANNEFGELGGHIASYASSADLFEVGFNHFFRGGADVSTGDTVYYQAHSAPGVYARAFLEGRLGETELAHFRQEVTASRDGLRGLSSYPHPWLMPRFWQFPTGSMGIGPISSIYQARFLRYLHHRGLMNTAKRKVWGVFGDGEMDEPESMCALSFAAREKLDNLIWIVNCNLQRLDGPVRSNGRIIDELEAVFAGAGWNVIKLIWGSDWDNLFFEDKYGALPRAFSQMVDGQLQTLAAKDGRYNRRAFFGQNGDLSKLADGLTDQQIDSLKRGGHDPVKIYAAYYAATQHRGAPSVILAQTKKGYGMGGAGEGKMSAHQQKKLDRVALLAFRDRFNLPLSDDDAANLVFYRPADNSPEMTYLHGRRRDLGGYIPERCSDAPTLPVPELPKYASFALAADQKNMSTTMAFVRMLTGLLRDKSLGPRVVPIVADEARTFGMASLFRQVGIYSSVGQKYEPEDIGSLLSYREAIDGQILEEGITEAGAISSWIAAGTSYSTYSFPMLPFYVFYSAFGFQRVGDLIWAAADQRVRGFLLGATAGRTTLSGEGLQHQDGSSHVVASTVPNCRSYDPAFAGELAVILDHGMRQMLEKQDDVFYYVTLMNESYPQYSLCESSREGIIKGLYHLRTEEVCGPRGKARLIGSGAILAEVDAAAKLLASDWKVEVEVWSATSYTELARDARNVERWNRFHADNERRHSHVEQCLGGSVPVVAVTDYVRALPQLISSSFSAPNCILGTDGFGRSDTRRRLREFFEVDRHSIVLAALRMLARTGSIERNACVDAVARYGITVESPAPWEC